MKQFSIDRFAETIKARLADADNKQETVRQALTQAIECYGTDEITRALQAAVPPGADVGEMIVNQSDEITMLYARIPAHFQSAIHDHTVFACMGQLSGEERSVVYEPADTGALRAVQTVAVTEGEVMSLPADAIHHIENPCDETSHSLHIYGGDFGAVREKRSLWSHDDHARTPFSFPALLQGSAAAMKGSGNQAGLDALVQAIPKAKPMVEAL
jgi:predicted metal-dependent enzyme (double-stranded beta helix superfamily)